MCITGGNCSILVFVSAKMQGMYVDDSIISHQKLSHFIYKNVYCTIEEFELVNLLDV